MVYDGFIIALYVYCSLLLLIRSTARAWAGFSLGYCMLYLVLTYGVFALKPIPTLSVRDAREMFVGVSIASVVLLVSLGALIGLKRGQWLGLLLINGLLVLGLALGMAAYVQVPLDWVVPRLSLPANPTWPTVGIAMVALAACGWALSGDVPFLVLVGRSLVVASLSVGLLLGLSHGLGMTLFSR